MRWPNCQGRYPRSELAGVELYFDGVFDVDVKIFVNDELGRLYQ